MEFSEAGQGLVRQENGRERECITENKWNREGRDLWGRDGINCEEWGAIMNVSTLLLLLLHNRLSPNSLFTSFYLPFHLL